VKNLFLGRGIHGVGWTPAWVCWLQETPIQTLVGTAEQSGLSVVERADTVVWT
jgi:hypothetical protein